MVAITFKVPPEEARKIRAAARSAHRTVSAHIRSALLPLAPALALASWASTAARTSDAYLVQLAESAGLKLATFDTGIPGAVQI